MEGITDAKLILIRHAQPAFFKCNRRAGRSICGQEPGGGGAWHGDQPFRGPNERRGTILLLEKTGATGVCGVCAAGVRIGEYYEERRLTIIYPPIQRIKRMRSSMMEPAESGREEPAPMNRTKSSKTGRMFFDCGAKDAHPLPPTKSSGTAGLLVSHNLTRSSCSRLLQSRKKSRHSD
jgi:hypothetical protein